MDTSPLCTTETTENGRVLVIALDNPPDNAVTPKMLEGVGRALDALAADRGPDLAVLTARGQVFSKGFDVGVIHSHGDRCSHRSSLLLSNDVCSRLAQSPKPTIVAINGHCFGAGLELALACHFRLCAEKARLGLPELSRGLIPGLGGVHHLVRLVGRAKALEFIAVGDLITAEEAHRVGLVNRVLPRAGFIENVLSFARAILSVDQALIRELIRLTAVATVEGHQDSVIETIESILRLSPPSPRRGDQLDVGGNPCGLSGSPPGAPGPRASTDS
ncbi:MAG: enoyl-CoA hydratase/isomerase family protein [Acidobacteriota bacterium]